MSEVRKIIRLSLSNIRKHRAEAFSLILLVTISMMVFGASVGSIGSIRNIVPDMMENTGCVPNYLIMDRSGYDPLFLTVIDDDENISECGAIDLLLSMESRFRDKSGTEPSTYMIFVTEDIEGQIERFMPETDLSEREISSMEHPVWLPFSVKDSLGFSEGETFDIILKNSRYPFTIAGFYDSGLYDLPGTGFKLIVSQEDYRSLSATVKRCTMIWYETKDGSGTTEYMNGLTDKIEDLIQRDISSSVYSMCAEVQPESNSIELLLYVCQFMSVIIFISVIVMIRHRIISDIDDQMVSIGVLEALGYRFSEISLSYVMEYVMLSSVGLALGTAGSFIMSPVLFRLGEILTGHHGKCVIGAWAIIMGGAGLLFFVTITAHLCAGRVKRYPPVTALRKGISGRHFSKNYFPLENTKRSVHLRLALKGFANGIRQDLGGGVCIAVSSAAIILCCIVYSFLGNDLEILRSFGGTEISDVQMVLTDQTDCPAFAEEIRSMPEVRKVILNGTSGQLKWNGMSVYPQVYEDYSQTESIKVLKGRYPQHENEVMIPNSASIFYDTGIGDTVTLSAGALSQDYLVTGISTAISENMLYLTFDGFARLRPTERPHILEIYLKDGADREGFIRDITARYGKSSSDASKEMTGSGSYEERIRAEAQRKMAILMERYGVDNIDYAIMSGDTMISGNSSAFRIEETVAVADLLETSLAADLAAITLAVKIFTVLMAAVIGIVLFMLMESSVRKQRRELGIMKSMGYTSKELMFQLACRIMPTAFIAAAIGTVISVAAARVLTGFFGKVPINIPHILIADAAVLVFCFISAYIGSRKIKKISVCELMTE